MPLKQFTIDFLELARDAFLRNDEKYHIFLNFLDWNLFESKSKDLVFLKDILVDDYSLFNYEDGEEYKGIPTGQTYLDEDGYIKEFQSVTVEDHPGRLKYKVSNDNILISSLRLAKSPALYFENQNLSDYVFSNGFYIYKIKEGWNRKFILYVLRTKKLKNALDNHIYRGIGISAYKDSDLKNIKIPFISKLKQDQIVAQIEPIEKKIKELKNQITPAQEIINKVFVKEFKFDLEKFEELKKKKFFEVDFYDFSGHKDARFGIGVRKANINIKSFISKKFEFIKLGKIISLEYGAGLTDQQRIEGEYPVMGANGIVGYHNKFLVEGPSIIVGRKGSVGEINYIEKNNYPIDTCFYVKFLQKQNIVYFSYLLKFFQLKRLTLFKGVPGLNRYDIYDVKIPDISLKDQQKIVDEIKTELDKQGEIKQKIEAKRAKIDEIIEEAIR